MMFAILLAAQAIPRNAPELPKNTMAAYVRCVDIQAQIRSENTDDAAGITEAAIKACDEELQRLRDAASAYEKDAHPEMPAAQREPLADALVKSTQAKARGQAQQTATETLSR